MMNRNHMGSVARRATVHIGGFAQRQYRGVASQRIGSMVAIDCEVSLRKRLARDGALDWSLLGRAMVGQGQNRLLMAQKGLEKVGVRTGLGYSRLYSTQGKYDIDISQFPLDKIRNFSIIAHIDHGKSTLADRLLELTGTITKKEGADKNAQVLDKLKVERDRGITVKAQSCSLIYEYKGEKYLLNLIDTPGHVDFSYEVSRSLYACQGAILLVDAQQGVQAQTMANFYLAFDSDLEIIPCMNKIDMSGAEPERVAAQMNSLFDFDPDDILQISAKTGQNCESVLPCVVERIPPPTGDQNAPPKALLFDSWYDQFRGVVCLVHIIDGSLKVGDKIKSANTNRQYEIGEIGIMHPEQTPTGTLLTGQVGYIIAGMKTTKEARVGDTLFFPDSGVVPLPGFKAAKPMVFAGVFPTDSDDYDQLKQALEKLTLNDASVSVQKESSAALGLGFRLGFLGMLHMDVFATRLQEEHKSNVITTTPSVPFKAVLKTGKEIVCENPESFPEPSKVDKFLEPMVLGTIVFPDEYMGKMINLCQTRRGVQKSMKFFGDSRVILEYILPLQEIATDFYDELKYLSSGYASFDYEEHGYEKSNLVKLEILLNGDSVDALSSVCHKDSAEKHGRYFCLRLKKVIHRQLFDIAIQAKAGGKIIARETIKAMRKNVTAKCYGGDASRKMKLLNKQKEGKKRMKMFGKVEVPREAFYQVIDKKNNLDK
eukprot:Nk52_evm51s151 gene=Nk52_evmTU51s151